MLIQRLFLFILLLIVSNQGGADGLPSTLKISQWDAKKGLSLNAATSIVSDEFGHIWIGTQDGLNRLNGYDVEQFGASSSQVAGLLHTHITTLAIDDDKTLWVGTPSAIYAKKSFSSEFSVVSQFQGEGARHTNHILAFNDRVFIATNKGLLLYQLVDQEIKFAGEFFTKHHVTSIASLKSGGLVLGTDQHELLILNKELNVVEKVVLPIESQFSRIYSIVEVKRDHLWVGYEGDGFFEVSYIDGRWSVALAGHHLSDIKRIVKDGLGKVWIGAENGISVFDQTFQEFRHFDQTTQFPLMDHYINDLYIDAKENVWFASQNSGTFVHNAQPSPFNLITSSLGEGALTNDAVLSIQSDKNHLWIGTANGLNLYDRGAKTSVRFRYAPGQPGSLQHDYVSAVIKDSAGQIWVGAKENGLTYFNTLNDTFEPVFQEHLSAVRIVHLFEDKDGQLFVSTRSHGLYIIDKSRTSITRWGQSDDAKMALPSSKIQYVFQDSFGDFWIGTFFEGLIVTNAQGEVQHHFKHNGEKLEGLSDDLVLSIMEDSSGRIWISTLSGLDLYDKSKGMFKQYSMKQGLPNDTIYGALEERKDVIWVSTNKGLAKIELTPRLNVNVYNSSNGLRADEFNSNAFHKVNENILVFGGVGGAVEINVKEFELAQSKPRANFISARVQNKVINEIDDRQIISSTIGTASSIDIGYGAKTFSLDFSSNEVISPQNIEYAYRLVGFDHDWTYVNADKNRATYTNLDAGHYQFELKARAINGNWGEIRTLDVNIAVSPWLSLPAKLAYLLIFGGSIFVWLRHKQRLLDAEREVNKAIRESQQQLFLSLWGSNTTLWDWDISKKTAKLIRAKTADVSDNQDMPFDLERLAEQIHPDDHGAVRKQLEDHLYGESSYYESIHRQADGNGGWHWILARGKVVSRDTSGVANRFIGSRVDITRVKQAEEELRELNNKLEDKILERTSALRSTNAELQRTIDKLGVAQGQLVEAEKMASLGQMVSGIAHEINTPIGVCITAITHLQLQSQGVFESHDKGMLKRSDFESFKNELESSSNLLVSNLERASNLITSFKQVSVDEETEPAQHFVLLKVIEDSLNMHRSEINRLNLQVSIMGATDLEVFTYFFSFNKVLSTLIENSLLHAFKSEKRGELSFQVYDDDEDFLLIYKDNGAGFDASIQEKIFEPFFTTGRSDGCVGLGMHIAYNLVNHKLRGTILCNSWLRRGTEFYVRLPKNVGR